MFHIVWANDISRWTDHGFHKLMQQKEKSFWITGYLVTGLEIISGESPDMMTGQIHFSLVTYCFSIFMTLILSFELSFRLCHFRNTVFYYNSVKIL